MRKGFTLTEMIVVIAIIGILVGTFVPTMSHYLPGIQLNGSARTLASNLREAQERAVTEQKQYLIRFFPATSPPSYQMIRIDNGNEEEIRSVNLPSDTSLTPDPTITLDPTTLKPQVIFSADGGPSSSGNITLGLGSVQKIINVSPAGFIAIK
jgi:prepilin-type N-terminal cleavage/methylation domain-containing protein